MTSQEAVSDPTVAAGGGPLATPSRGLIRRFGLSQTTAITAATLIVILLVWQAITSFQVVNGIFLPSPASVWKAFVDLTTVGFLGHTLPQDLVLSLERVAVGFISGTLVGTALGLLMGSSRNVNAFVNPLLQFFRPLPPLSYLVLIIAVFGIGEFPQYLLLFLAALPVAAIAARDGVAQTALVRIQVAQSLGARRRDVFTYVVLPSALPQIFTGLQLAIGVVYSTLIAAEIISGSAGVGFLIYESGSALRSDFVFVGIVILGVLGLILYALLRIVERKVVHWAGRG